MKTQHIMSLAAATSSATLDPFSKQTIEKHLSLNFPGHETAGQDLKLYYDQLRFQESSPIIDGCPHLSSTGAITLYSASGHHMEVGGQPWEVPYMASTADINVASFQYLVGERGRCGMIYIRPQDEGLPVYDPPSQQENTRGITLEELKITPQKALEKARHELPGGTFAVVSLKRSGSAGDGEPTYTFHGQNMTLVHVCATDGSVRVEDEWNVVWEELGARNEEEAAEILERLS